MIALSFLSAAEAPLTHEVEAAFHAYCSYCPASIKHAMLQLLAVGPAKFRATYPLALAKPR